MGEVLHPRDVSRDIFSATVGSVFCCYTGQPFDTVKVRMQTNPELYSGIFKTATTTMSEEGIRAFWKGAVPTAMGMAAENAMAFGVNEALKRAFPDPNKGQLDHNGEQHRPDLLRPFLMGAITGCCSALVLLPSEVVKAKTQVAVGTEVSSNDIFKRMVKKQGYRSLFCGLDAQLMRDGPFYAFFFGSYEMSCYLFRTYVPSMPDELNYFLSGGLAGMLGWTAAMPFDVPKTNVQSRYDTRVIGSYFPEMIRIAKERGFLGLYNGLGPTLVRAFPANAALFLGVEMGKKFFDKFLWA
uniref:Mitochondrial carrier protein n=2 Tax=Helicotheca tamesis TaxID=374047 RepID=A0A7S2IAM9_9STRA|mmetsp:Transcript_7395/g.10050  ORF Transcript_7395/g.10050 Transcript_7395/m.10050 type:complete len:297 (+) Transcript_7395:194-1084(+)|eukprot:CAMPEP_0185732168 /NCGR_PEP_ID=MMETSP1171-20130828/15228_1 /TAXON_ID=374046 /ORGANISM="Helicotheca tamensis, Strain CCMP826" /LENGTH=296 /DNA_ID=CAMNT_0028401589 /DNA_START=116 /DNA_END=1006 /DNA_ORIENTATION=-